MADTEDLFEDLRLANTNLREAEKAFRLANRLHRWCCYQDHLHWFVMWDHWAAAATNWLQVTGLDQQPLGINGMPKEKELS